MKISMEKLLAKMEAELQQARASTTEEGLRERIYSIKILCELILDEQKAQPQTLQPRPAAVPQPTAFQQPIVVQPQPISFQPQPSIMPQPKKLEMDDDANGDSLFDF